MALYQSGARSLNWFHFTHPWKLILIEFIWINSRLVINCMPIHTEDDNARILIHFVRSSHLWGWLCFGIELSTDFPFPAEISIIDCMPIYNEDDNERILIHFVIFLTFEVGLYQSGACSLNWFHFTRPWKYKLIPFEFIWIASERKLVVCKFRLKTTIGEF